MTGDELVDRLFVAALDHGTEACNSRQTDSDLKTILRIALSYIESENQLEVFCDDVRRKLTSPEYKFLESLGRKPK